MRGRECLRPHTRTRTDIGRPHLHAARRATEAPRASPERLPPLHVFPSGPSRLAPPRPRAPPSSCSLSRPLSCPSATVSSRRELSLTCTAGLGPAATREGHPHARPFSPLCGLLLRRRQPSPPVLRSETQEPPCTPASLSPICNPFLWPHSGPQPSEVLVPQPTATLARQAPCHTDSLAEVRLHSLLSLAKLELQPVLVVSPHEPQASFQMPLPPP